MASLLLHWSSPPTTAFVNRVALSSAIISRSRTSPISGVSWRSLNRSRKQRCIRLSKDRGTQRTSVEEEEASNELAAFFSPEDLGYLWKLLTGSIVGAVSVKYGSILVPEITRPNITQALLMICVPVVVSVLLLINASSRNNEDKDQYSV